MLPRGFAAEIAALGGAARVFDTFFATVAKSAPPFSWSSAACASFFASSSEWPTVASGVALTFTRMWLAHASSGVRNSALCALW
jgi:hypothetical protein